MGQLNFFMTKEEIYNEVQELIDSEFFELFQGSFFLSENPKPLSKPLQINETKLLIIWVKNKVNQPKFSSKGLGENVGKFTFDYLYDPIIEFEINIPINNIISPSRLFYKTGWISDIELRNLHVKVTNKLVRNLKKRLLISNVTKPFYISKGIINLLENGFELELGSGGKIINKDIINCTY